MIDSNPTTKIANLITVTVHVIIKHFIVQKCESMSSVNVSKLELYMSENV